MKKNPPPPPPLCLLHDKHSQECDSAFFVKHDLTASHLLFFLYHFFCNLSISNVGVRSKNVLSILINIFLEAIIGPGCLR